MQPIGRFAAVPAERGHTNCDDTTGRPAARFFFPTPEQACRQPAGLARLTPLVPVQGATHHARMTQPATRTQLEPLDKDEVHVWHFACHRAQGRAPLLALLARYTGAEQTALVSGAHGRPRLAQGPAGLDFNWSHSGEVAVVALARGIVPGVDVEWVRPRPRAMDLARRFFHPQEAAALQALPAGERERAFLELWTAKEAVLKATGHGISFGLQRLRVGRERALRLAWLDGDDAAAWQLQALELGAGCVAALAWRGGPRRIVMRTLATARAPVQCGSSSSSTPPTAP